MKNRIKNRSKAIYSALGGHIIHSCAAYRKLEPGTGVLATPLLVILIVVVQELYIKKQDSYE